MSTSAVDRCRHDVLYVHCGHRTGILHTSAHTVTRRHYRATVLWLVHSADATRQDSFVSSQPSFDESASAVCTQWRRDKPSCLVRVGDVNKP